MAFNPCSVVNLCVVPWDISYKNQVHFKTVAEQNAYFTNGDKVKCVWTFTEFLTVRKTLPNGSSVSAIRVSVNIDKLYNVNYMWYINDNHGDKRFYAFVTKLIYINENTTEIVFETDAYQTWMFDIELLPSFVEREHPTHDLKFSHMEAEKFDVDEYVYTDTGIETGLDEVFFLVAAPAASYADGSGGMLVNGIYQGLNFSAFKTVAEVNSYIGSLNLDEGQEPVFITALPKFNLVGTLLDAEGNDIYGPVYSAGPNWNILSLKSDDISALFGDYKPKNNKLYNYPYNCISITNNSGDEILYRFEHFDDNTFSGNTYNFKMYGDLCASPTTMIVPQNYEGVEDNVDKAIALASFPQCSYTSDSYKLWLARNQFGNKMQIILGAVQLAGSIAGGVAATSATAGTVTASTPSVNDTSGLSTIVGAISDEMRAKKAQDSSRIGQGANNLLTAMGKNDFSIRIARVKKHQAEAIDNFFTMFGYAINRIKVPNVAARPAFTYVKTIDVNIKGAIPNEDLSVIRNMFDNGVTLWTPTAVVGDYSADNYGLFYDY